VADNHGLALYSGTFGFAKTDLGTAGTVILTIAEMAGYPYEPIWVSDRRQGYTAAGGRYCYVRWKNKLRWPLHFEAETQETTDLLGSCFRSEETFYFNPNVGVSEWYLVWCVNEEFAPRETFIGLWSFEATIEEA
jgi:hypothetical protein